MYFLRKYCNIDAASLWYRKPGLNHHETDDDRDEDKISMIRLGLKANLNLLLLLVLVNAFVGAMNCLEQTDSLQTDIASLSSAIQIVAWISLGSGIFVLVFMQEPERRTYTDNILFHW